MNTARTKRHYDRLKERGGTRITIRLTPEAVKELARLCEALRMSRQAMINRLIVTCNN